MIGSVINAKDPLITNCERHPYRSFSLSQRTRTREMALQEMNVDS